MAIATSAGTSILHLSIRLRLIASLRPPYLTTLWPHQGQVSSIATSLLNIPVVATLLESFYLLILTFLLLVRLHRLLHVHRRHFPTRQSLPQPSRVLATLPLRTRPSHIMPAGGAQRPSMTSSRLLNIISPATVSFQASTVAAYVAPRSSAVSTSYAIYGPKPISMNTINVVAIRLFLGMRASKTMSIRLNAKAPMHIRAVAVILFNHMQRL